MKTANRLLIILMVLPLVAGGGTMLDRIHWLGHDSFRIDWEGKVILIDPYDLAGQSGKKADVIFVTHSHGDHLSVADLQKCAGPSTVIVAPANGAEKLAGFSHVIKVQPGESGMASGVKFRAVAAYNTNKQFHPAANGWVGYLLDLGGTTVYHAGDTDRIPEMKGLRPSIALLPVSGTYVMTAAEAVQAALDLQAGTVIPMHYGAIVGGEEDARQLAKGLEGKIPVVIKARESF